MRKIAIIILGVALISCIKKKGMVNKEAPPKIKGVDIVKKIDTLKKGIENDLKFEDFLERFSKDSIFRYDRMKFPIKGYNSDAETNKKDYKWEKEEWMFYFNNDLKHNTDENIISKIVPNDTVIIWRLYKENSGYDVNYYFKQIDNKWYLDSYSYKNY